MEIIEGYFYHIKDEFFEKINSENILLNHDKGHSRPSYFVIKEDELLWFIPLSSRVPKYRKIIEQKIKKYGKCRSIIIKKIGGIDQVILIQNAFPTLEKYVNNIHIVNRRPVTIPTSIKREIINDFKYLLFLKEKGNNLFFTDIDRIKDQMLDELSIKS